MLPYYMYILKKNNSALLSYVYFKIKNSDETKKSKICEFSIIFVKYLNS